MKQIRDLVGFDPSIDTYISERALFKMLSHCSSAEEGAVGYLLGELLPHEGKSYTLIEDAVADYWMLDSLSQDRLILGWYYSTLKDESPSTSKFVDVESSILVKRYFTFVAVNPKLSSVATYKKTNKHFIEVEHLVAPDMLGTEEIPILLGDASEEVRKTGVYLEFFMLMLLSLVLGMFGGIAAYLLTRIHGMRNIAFLLVGVISTNMWFMIGQVLY